MWLPRAFASLEGKRASNSTADAGQLRTPLRSGTWPLWMCVSTRSLCIRHPTVASGHGNANEPHVRRAEQAGHPRVYFQASQRACISATLRNAMAGKPSGGSRQATVSIGKAAAASAFASSLPLSVFVALHTQLWSRQETDRGDSICAVVLPAWQTHLALPSTPDLLIAGRFGGVLCRTWICAPLNMMSAIALNREGCFSG